MQITRIKQIKDYRIFKTGANEAILTSRALTSFTVAMAAVNRRLQHS